MELMQFYEIVTKSDHSYLVPHIVSGSWKKNWRTGHGVYSRYFGSLRVPGTLQQRGPDQSRDNLNRTIGRMTTVILPLHSCRQRADTLRQRWTLSAKSRVEGRELGGR